MRESDTKQKTYKRINTMTDSLQQTFEQAAKDIKNLSRRPDNQELLTLYALYKQATDGDVTGKRPGMLDVKGRAKYDSWTKQKGTQSDQAKEEYIDLVKQLQNNDS